MSATRKILVVDDDPVVSKSIGRVLSNKGYAVIAAQNGEEALRKLDSEKYDLVFTDIKMPGMSGLEVAERVKASQPWLPVVIVTGYGTDASEARAAAAGVSGFLRKPLSPEMIVGSTEQALQEAEATPVAETVAVEADEAVIAPMPEIAKAGNTLKNIALFLAAPFIGLAYVIAMPFVGAGMLAWMGGKALFEKAPIVKTVVMTVATPFIGLAFILVAPIVGIGALGWYGTKALLKHKD
ncbi:MAG: response regulator [Proteobacteria bacterium]|nr:response regulator [Pseudomonadota bacterium]